MASAIGNDVVMPEADGGGGGNGDGVVPVINMETNKKRLDQLMQIFSDHEVWFQPYPIGASGEYHPAGEFASSTKSMCKALNIARWFEVPFRPNTYLIYVRLRMEAIHYSDAFNAPTQYEEEALIGNGLGQGLEEKILVIDNREVLGGYERDLSAIYKLWADDECIECCRGMSYDTFKKEIERLENAFQTIKEIAGIHNDEEEEEVEE